MKKILLFPNSNLNHDQRIIRLVLGLLLAFALILPGVFSPETLHLVDCGFLNATGYPCPSCGLTRSFHEMGTGNFLGAFSWNFFGPILYALIFIGSVKLLSESVFGKVLFSLKGQRIGLFVFFVAFWLFMWILILIV